MAHTLFTLVVKAQDQDEAIEKAKYTMDNYLMGDPNSEYCLRDSYFIVGHEEKSHPNRVLDFQNQMETQFKQAGATITSLEFKQEGCVRVSRLDSQHGQEFFKRPFDSLKKARKIYDSDKDLPMELRSHDFFNAFHYITHDYTYDENGKPIRDELPYHEAAKDYFVVPVDVHS
jgi:hypothetical protein